MLVTEAMEICRMQLEATQPLLMVAMLEAQKRKDGEFLSHLQTTYAANEAALERVEAKRRHAEGDVE